MVSARRNAAGLPGVALAKSAQSAGSAWVTAPTGVPLLVVVKASIRATVSPTETTAVSSTVMRW